MRAAQAGQEGALAELFLRNRVQVMRSVSRITKNKEDAEDAFQDAMLRAFVHLHQFDGRSTFNTWFTRIAINSSLRTLRKRSKGYHVSVEDHDEFDGSRSRVYLADRSADPEQQYAKREIETQLSCAISRLPRSLRSVVETRRSEELSIAETAAALTISIAAAKSRLYRAKNELRKSLAF